MLVHRSSWRPSLHARDFSLCTENSLNRCESLSFFVLGGVGEVVCASKTLDALWCIYIFCYVYAIYLHKVYMLFGTLLYNLVPKVIVVSSVFGFFENWYFRRQFVLGKIMTMPTRPSPGHTTCPRGGCGDRLGLSFDRMKAPNFFASLWNFRFFELRIFSNL